VIPLALIRGKFSTLPKAREELQGQSVLTDGSQHSTKIFPGKKKFALFIILIFIGLQPSFHLPWSTKTFRWKTFFVLTWGD